MKPLACKSKLDIHAVQHKMQRAYREGRRKKLMGRLSSVGRATDL
jgi:hypothetical protein